ncbi:hypothetical protein PVL29_009223 [Vitis rotundifolia]|uniref:Uncharacterized protein n=1 Tax=Vitis rotundifolia TaxID=103349 RepID=A0AA38ZXV7_VITRO|nr:hypothetical protein PVL29_009223 [Vitis rotundifolia]
MGFKGLLDLACWELRYELCAWIISNYDIAYPQLNMAISIAIPIIEDVSKVMGIPSNGVDIVVHTRKDTSNRTYTISLLEQNLYNLPISDEFRKTFLIFSCATILALNSKLEGMHDLWDTIWDGDVGLFYMTKFYMPSITVDLPESTGHSHALTATRTSSACDNATEVIDVFIHSKAHIGIVVSQLCNFFPLLQTLSFCL